MIRGIKLEGNKKMSITNEIVDMCDPKVVYVPLVNYREMNCNCTVKIGKKVRKGSIIGIRENINFPILSPISGTVIDIKKCLYLNGESVNSVVIENDGKERSIKKTGVDDITAYSKEGFIEIIKECAVTGMGGSDFPTYIKYDTKLDTLIVNAVESEPYITADLMLIKLKAKEILEAINAIMIVNDIKKCYIAIAENNSAISALERCISIYPNIEIKKVKDIYPMGWERYLVKYILSKNYDKLPSEVGTVVNNVSTIFAIYKALKFQRPITKRIITISGERFNEPVNVLVKLGTRIKDVIKKLGGYDSTSTMKLIAGGPMMGNALVSDDVIVTKNLNSILIVNDIDDYYPTACIKCGKCDNICPAKLSPIYILKNLKNIKELKELLPSRCMECGLCSYICPSKIDLRAAVKAAKKEVEK